MERRKKVIDTEQPKESVEEVVIEKPIPTPIPKKVSNDVRKLIANPLRLNSHIILSNDKAFTIPDELLKDEMFMANIEHLITLDKLERV